jgi:uncharacterized membrane protein YfcA
MDPSLVPWWAWPVLLFAVAFVLGIVAVIGGIGGGVLFVPIVAGFFPFHLDFVRGAGLLLALSGAIAAGPGLLRGGLADLRLAMPLALAGSIGAIAGAFVGLALPTQVLHLALGITVLGIAWLMWATREETGAIVGERHRWPLGLVTFGAIGVVGGMFGLGAGWANVPALTLLMGLPLKLAVGTSGLTMSIMNTSAAWVYLNEGAMLPILHVPSILGVMLGARVGVRLLKRVEAATARRVIIGALLVAGVRSVLQGAGY